MAVFRAALTLAMAIPVLTVQAQPSPSEALPEFCAAVMPQFGPLGYKRRAVNRCEGLYEPKVGAPPVELLSLTYASTTSPGAISLGPHGDYSSPVHVLGVSLVPDEYYRFDAMLSESDRTMSFDPDGIARRSGLEFSDIGLVATAGGSFLPVVLLQDGSVGEDWSIDVIFRLASLATEVAWRWSEGCALDGDWTAVPGSVFPPGAPIRLDGIRPADAQCDLTVIAYAPNRAPVSKTWHVVFGANL